MARRSLQPGVATVPYFPDAYGIASSNNARAMRSASCAAFGGGDADDQAVRRLPVDPFASRPYEIEVLPSVGTLEFFQEPSHFVCLVSRHWLWHQATRNPEPSGLPGLPRQDVTSYIASPAAETRSPSLVRSFRRRARARSPPAKADCLRRTAASPSPRTRTVAAAVAPRRSSSLHCHVFRSFPSFADARKTRAPTRTASPRTAGGTNGEGLILLRPSDCSAYTPGGTSSGRVGLQRRHYAGIDRRKTVPQHARHGNANGPARRMGAGEKRLKWRWQVVMVVG